MNKIGLIITINKFKRYFETQQTTLVCETIEEAREKLLEYLSKELECLNIDYPLDLTDFEHYWFGQQYINTNAFYYKLFMEGSWHEPWDQQEIYSDVLDRIEKNDLLDPPVFDEIYGEPNPDEDTVDNFSMENDEQIHELEKKFTEIIKQAKIANIKEDSVKECLCEKCVEAHGHEDTEPTTKPN
jgi:hypothetical protein